MDSGVIYTNISQGRCGVVYIIVYNWVRLDNKNKIISLNN